MSLLLALSVTGSVMRLVSKVSGYSILLQSTSITLLPFGAVLIAAGLFIGDSTGAGGQHFTILNADFLSKSRVSCAFLQSSRQWQRLRCSCWDCS